MKLFLIALTFIGLNACSVSDTALCGALKKPVTELRAGLANNLDTTPDEVGEPATDTVRTVESGCLY